MPIYFGETQITKIYKGEAQLDRVIIADAIVDIYTFGDGNTTTTTPPTTTPDPTPICCACSQGQISNDYVCELVTAGSEYVELCSGPNAVPLCPDGTCDCHDAPPTTTTTTPDPTPICCICTQSGNDVICETVTGEYAELCNEPNASPLCPDETCNCYET